MCGITGLYDRDNPPTDTLLERMSTHMQSRGPDDFGTFTRDALGVAHRRLSIIDLAGGHQPMFNEDRTLVLVFNGEIYGFQQHRDELIGKGHIFGTSSDSEILLHLYEEHGVDMLPMLNGMFAFAIAHVQTGEIFIARDRLGQKPLFYAQEKSRFAFASGPSSFGSLDWVDRSIDPQAIESYLEFFYIPCPHSIFRGVKKLEPGQWVRFKDGNLQSGRYWSPSVNETFTGSYADAQSQLKELMQRAVDRRLVADVPVGMFLSGGMDSSLICALAQQTLANPAETFSIGFPDPRYDERQYAEIVAKHLGTNHHFLEVNPEDMSQLDRIVAAYEEPFADSSMLPSVLLSEFARKHVTVSLSGDAADELFGGYYRYQAFHQFGKLDFLPLPLRRLVSGTMNAILPRMAEERTLTGKLRRACKPFGADGVERYLRMISRLSNDQRKSIFGPTMREASVLSSAELLTSKSARELRDINALIELEMKTYLTDDILVKVDRASMAHSLEVRSPFLDPEVVDFAASLPFSFKQHGGLRKRILCDTFRDMLPSEIFTRRKMGFGVPIASWLRGTWKNRAHKLLLDGKLCDDGLFDRKGLEQILTAHNQKSSDFSYAIYALMVLAIWIDKQD